MIECKKMSSEEKLEWILAERAVYPVFQPIVSLRDGRTLGFEALSRVSEEGVFDDVEEMFCCAERMGKIWELEQVCRRAVFESISEQREQLKGTQGRIFVNVNPRVLYDAKFKEGFTRTYTTRYGIDTESIVFEVTERQRIEDEAGFLDAINHYKRQNYQIAVDDVGAGYSGLNRVCSLSPNYIKLDIELVRDVHKNPTKLALIKGLVDFSVNSGTLLIAEGIETKKEMEVLMELGVQYGQGYYLARPERMLCPCGGRAYKEILQKSTRGSVNHYLGIGRYYIKNIVSPGITVSSHVKAEQVLAYLEKNEDALGVCVLEGEHVVGTMTREKIRTKLSGRYGFSLYHNKEIGQMADTDFLQVEGVSSISNVANIAMERDRECLYDFIVVSENGKYSGIVTVQDLLQRAMKINVELAKSSNPLTGLPGNVAIDQEIQHCVDCDGKYTIYYLDIDNFKAFNDTYGFEKGDEVIRILADILKERAGKEDFVGHIGGDDFVMICQGYQPQEFVDRIRKEFEEKARQLYNERHKQQNYITARNRHGIMECFPLVSVTIVSVSNEKAPFAGCEEISNLLSAYKKQEKMNKKNVSA